MSTLRRRIELKAGPLVILLARLPRAVPFLIIAGLLIAGLVFQGIAGALLLSLLALLLVTLLVLSWPALLPPARFLRLLVVALVAVRACLFLF